MFYLITSIFVAMILVAYIQSHEKWGVLFNPKALWLGLHKSEHNKRYCLNLVPTLTIWWVDKGGAAPNYKKNEKRNNQRKKDRRDGSLSQNNVREKTFHTRNSSSGFNRRTNS